jgi:hypothetical protein
VGQQEANPRGKHQFAIVIHENPASSIDTQLTDHRRPEGVIHQVVGTEAEIGPSVLIDQNRIINEAQRLRAASSYLLRTLILKGWSVLLLVFK